MNVKSIHVNIVSLFSFISITHHLRCGVSRTLGCDADGPSSNPGGGGGGKFLSQYSDGRLL